MHAAILLILQAPLLGLILFQTGGLDIIGLIVNGFASLGGLTALVIVLAELVDRFWKLDGLVSNVRAVVIGIILGEIGALFHLGMFADPAIAAEAGTFAAWYWVGLFVGLQAGLQGSLLFMLPIAKAILEAIKIRPKA